jgi:hypothetical protein
MEISLEATEGITTHLIHKGTEVYIFTHSEKI